MDIQHNKEGRFYVKTAHGEAELLYDVKDGKVMRIYHTFTPEEDRGKGIAENLAEEAFKFAEKNGFKVRPDCPYITHFVEKNPKFQKFITKR